MKKTFILLLALIAATLPARAHTREEVRAAYAFLVAPADRSPYAELPAVSSPYAAGALTDGARSEALGFLNFARWLAGVDPVTDSAIYDFQCQHGAVLLAALDYVAHDAPNPGDMDENFYASAHNATLSSNVARFNWMRPTILREGVEYFLRDDGEENLAELGHRRWALNPVMAATGFGLANAESGMSYVTMYAHDLGNPDAEWDHIAWPAGGAFPAELIHDHLAWSVSLNPECYDLSAGGVEITLREENSGMRFDFFPADGTGDGFCAMNLEGYGAGPCLVFRPDFTGKDFSDYEQNQRWRVRVEGLTGSDGAPRSLEYAVDMISLYTQDVVNVEIDPVEATLAPGQTLQLSAAVVPAYADDTAVAWRTSDRAVATVDANGLVAAVGPGQCEIVASAGGYEDACLLSVASD